MGEAAFSRVAEGIAIALCPEDRSAQQSEQPSAIYRGSPGFKSFKTGRLYMPQREPRGNMKRQSFPVVTPSPFGEGRGEAFGEGWGEVVNLLF